MDIYIVLTGRRQHGKDTVADIALTKFSCTAKVALADWFKEELSKLFGIPLDQFYSTAKDLPFISPLIITEEHLRRIPYILYKYGYDNAFSLSLGHWYGRPLFSIRDMMLWFGNEVVYNCCGSEFHCRATQRRIEALPSTPRTAKAENEANVYIITDARFYEQSRYFLESYPFAYTISITRPDGPMDDNPVENAVDQFPAGYFFRTIVNDGSLTQLENKVREVLSDIYADVKRRLGGH